jgi:hypothetical protein
LADIKKAAALESGVPSQVTKGHSALRVRAAGGGRKKLSDQELAALNINRDAFHGEWNYRVLPHNSLA